MEVEDKENVAPEVTPRETLLPSSCCSKRACCFAEDDIEVASDTATHCLKCGGHSHSVCSKMVGPDMYICGACLGWETEQSPMTETEERNYLGSNKDKLRIKCN